MSQSSKPLKIGGQIAVRCMQAERLAIVGTSRVWNQGRDDLGVHPNQVKAMNNLLMRRGCKPAHFDEEGSCHPNDRTHVNSILAARGMCDQDAGYGDRAPGTPLAQSVVDNI